MANSKIKTSVILTVRVYYTHDGREAHPENTAARMVVNDQFHTIENGVEVCRVEVYHDGDELFIVDENTPQTPDCYRVEHDKKTGKVTIWDDCAGVGLRFRPTDTMARYNSELIARAEYTRTEAGLEELTRIQDELTAWAALRFPYQFREVVTPPGE